MECLLHFAEHLLQGSYRQLCVFYLFGRKEPALNAR